MDNEIRAFPRPWGNRKKGEKLSAGPPRFRITLVLDGRKFGLLIEKQKANVPPQRCYFWVDCREGLELSDEVLGEWHATGVKLHDRAAQTRIIGELKALAEEAHRIGKVTAFKADLSPDHPKKGFAQEMAHFFEQGDESFVNFFGDRKVFRETVFRKPPGNDVLIANAEFGIIDASARRRRVEKPYFDEVLSRPDFNEAYSYSRSRSLLCETRPRAPQERTRSSWSLAPPARTSLAALLLMKPGSQARPFEVKHDEPLSC